jgi:Flp pilus assembly protein CpaB
VVDYAERVLSTRRGAILVAVGAAVLAGIILIVYIRNYRHSVANGQQVSVLVARNLIPKGTPGSLVGTKHLYEISSVAKSDVLPGAYTDPSALTTGVAAANIYPGQQLNTTDFVAATNTLDTQIRGTQRALTLPIDSTRTLGDQLVSGDKVDIYISLNGDVRQILESVPVLVAPSGGTITVQVNSKTAALLALAVDTGKIWFTLRPAVGARLLPLATAKAQQLQR